MVKEGLINLDFADVRSVMRGMGKAMMGTGEASGEKRAQQAAEAAIANPLLDESSMKGAKGLLISITGGNDLTLFEVDEAATRIREEVDADANIILGATFDETLDGIIRVSVVATGIDREEGQLAGTFPAAAAPALKSETLAAPRIPEIQTKPALAAEAPKLKDAAAKAVANLEKELAIPEPQPVAVASDPDVEIKKVQPASTPVAETTSMIDLENDTPAPVVDETPMAQPYIPPAAEEHAPAPRMPRVEDFPPIAQREIMANTAPVQESAPVAAAPAAPAMTPDVVDEHEHEGDEERRPMGLLRRLASGLGRREDEEEHLEEAPAPEVRPAAQMRPAPRAPQARLQNDGAAGQLDTTGRATPAPVGQSEDDQLEIPAFLRRQAN
jgi:cell division protein FtsZ